MSTRHLDVARDVLDKLVVDRDGRPMGRVDSVTAAVTDKGRLRLESIVIGPIALAERAAPRFGRWVAALERWLGTIHGRPVTIPFDLVDVANLELTANLRAGDTAAMLVEQKLQRWLTRIPGSR